MAAELEFREATSDDTDRILELVRVSLGEGQVPRHSDYWRWKHQDNPFGSSPILLAVAGRDLVGLRVFMRWGWEAAGSQWCAVRAVDTATHPDWRGRGVFSRLTRTLLEKMSSEGVSFVFNTPNSQSLPGYLKMGWRKVGRVSLWIRPIHPGALLSAALSSTAAAPSADADSGFEIGSPAGERLCDPALPGFLKMLPSPHDRFSTRRSIEYLQWRYGAIPGIRYRVAMQIDGSRGAVVIFRVRRRERLRELRLCEVLVGPGQPSREVARELLGSIIAQVDADFAATMAPIGSPAFHLLAGSGFLPAPRFGPVMTVRPLNEDRAAPDPLRRSDWHLSIGDLELF